jgi:hypothetical protein
VYGNDKEQRCCHLYKQEADAARVRLVSTAFERTIIWVVTNLIFIKGKLNVLRQRAVQTRREKQQLQETKGMCFSSIIQSSICMNYDTNIPLTVMLFLVY